MRSPCLAWLRSSPASSTIDILPALQGRGSTELLLRRFVRLLATCYIVTDMSMTTAPWVATDEDELDEEPEEAEEAPSAGKGTTKTAHHDNDGKAQAPKPRRSTGARRAVERALAIARLERRQRELLARVLGERGYDDSDDDIARVVLASLEPESVALSALPALLEISGADPLEAGVTAMDLASDRKLLSGAWAALAQLGVVKGQAPTTTAKAGLAIAKAAQGLPGQALADLQGAISVLGN